ncbi:MAG: hypothetical protein HY650_04290 [Acidobacteria bacterium]|nr:hypothetical protein [Acidobacteriota bacterium]
MQQNDGNLRHLISAGLVANFFLIVCSLAVAQTKGERSKPITPSAITQAHKPAPAGVHTVDTGLNGTTDLFVPLLGSGAQTDQISCSNSLSVHNPTYSPANVQVFLFHLNQSNPAPAVYNDTLAPQETRRYGRPEETLFGETGPSVLRVVSDRSLVVRSAHEPVSPSPESAVRRPASEGVMQQYSAPIPAGFAMAEGRKTKLLGVHAPGLVTSVPDDTVIGLVETTGDAALVRISLVDETGSVLAGRDINLSGFEPRLHNLGELLSGSTASRAGLEVEILSGPGKVIAFGSALSSNLSGLDSKVRDDQLEASADDKGKSGKAVDKVALPESAPAPQKVSQSGMLAGSGLSGQIAVWTGATALGNSSISQNGPNGNVFIGANPSQVEGSRLNVDGEGRLLAITATNYQGDAAIQGSSTSGKGVVGSSVMEAGIMGGSVSNAGVLGTSESGRGVQGMSKTLSGVYGESEMLHGVGGLSKGGGFGVLGRAEGTSLAGVHGRGTGDADGVQGEAEGGGIGVKGKSSSAAGVMGESSGSAPGVEGKGNPGVRGESTSGGVGVEGKGNPGLRGESTGGVGVEGKGNPGLRGEGTGGGTGVVGESTTGRGVEGRSDSRGGVVGISNTSVGVTGESTSSNGVQGKSDSGVGVAGISTSSAGVIGESTSGHGVEGRSTSDTGVEGVSLSGVGVEGRSQSHSGVEGESNSGIGVFGSSQSASGVEGRSDNRSGVSGTSPSWLGVRGESTDGYGVQGSSQSSLGIGGFSKSGTGVQGRSDSGYGLLGISTSSNGIQGESKSLRGVVGISEERSGVLGLGTNGVAVSGESTGSAGGFFTTGTRASYGIVAGCLEGVPSCRAALLNGSLQTVGVKFFHIDHPLYPASKYLNHASVESSEIKNLYDGLAVLDGNGEAVVTLPEWFEALNKEFRYQLTAVGAAGPNLYVAEEVANNRFRIAGGTPGMKVLWQVTGNRQDAYAKANPMEVEENKSDAERGHYLNPELFGQPKEKNILRLYNSDFPRPIAENKLQGENRGSAVMSMKAEPPK